MSSSIKRKVAGQPISKLVPLDTETTDPKCGVCSQAADKRCGNCLLTFYCGTEHQKQDWKDHRKICCPFQVKYSEELGRYLVASRDLEEKALVIHEAPFAFAPYDEAAGSERIPMCLGCCYRMSDAVDRRCSLCNWPVCSQECEEMSSHTHHECSIFQERKVEYPPPHPEATYSSILVLRLILQKEKSPSLWQKFLQMEDHTKSRSSRDDDSLILENLREYLDPAVMDTMTEKEIAQIIGRVNVNSFGVTRREEGKNDDTVGRGVFLTTGIVAHGCVPNAVWGISYSPSFEIVVKTGVPIKKGEVITPTYSDAWNSLGTYQRQVIMLERSGYQCHCKRCLDPKELDTYLSAVRCAKCQEAFLLPKNPIDLSDMAPWQCENAKCAATEIQITIINLVEEVQYEVDLDIAKSRFGYSSQQDDEDEEGDENENEDEDKPTNNNSNGVNSGRGEDLEELYEKFCGTLLHDNHFVVRTIEKAIVEKLYPLLPSASFAELNSFIFHCENLLRVDDVLTPGYCGSGGFLRSYLCQGLIQKKTKAVKEGSVSAVFKSTRAFNEHLRRIDKLKKEVTMLWEHDPDSTPMTWESYITRDM